MDLPILPWGASLQQSNETPFARQRHDLAQGFGWRKVAALASVTMTVVLVVLVASLPWWGLSFSDGRTETYYLGVPCYSGGSWGAGSCGEYGDRSAPLRDVFPVTFRLVLTALALSVFELVFLVRAAIGRGHGFPILVTGILGSIALMVAPAYLSLGLSGSTFSGSQTFNGLTHTSAQGSGWLLAPVVACFFLGATVVAFLAARHLAAGSARAFRS